MCRVVQATEEWGGTPNGTLLGYRLEHTTSSSTAADDVKQGKFLRRRDGSYTNS